MFRENLTTCWLGRSGSESMLLAALWARATGPAVVLVALAASISGCTGVFFQPLRPHIFDPRKAGAVIEDHYFESADGTRLHSWYLPPVTTAETPAKGTILFLHGNAENVSTHIGSVYWLPAHGYGVLLLEYRGYGLSAGEPSFDGLLEDVGAADHYLDTLPGVHRERVVLLGQSLGGALGVLYAASPEGRGRFAAVIVDSGFASSRGIVRDTLAKVLLGRLLKYPLSWLVDGSYNPEDVIERISPTPVLISHSVDDTIIPFSHGERLFARAGSPKDFLQYEGAGHIGALHSEQGRSDLLEYLARTVNR